MESDDEDDGTGPLETSPGGWLLMSHEHSLKQEVGGLQQKGFFLQRENGQEKLATAVRCCVDVVLMLVLLLR